MLLKTRRPCKYQALFSQKEESSSLDLPKHLRNFYRIHAVNEIEKHPEKNCPVVCLRILN